MNDLGVYSIIGCGRLDTLPPPKKREASVVHSPWSQSIQTRCPRLWFCPLQVLMVQDTVDIFVPHMGVPQCGFKREPQGSQDWFGWSPQQRHIHIAIASTPTTLNRQTTLSHRKLENRFQFVRLVPLLCHMANGASTSRNTEISKM